MIPIAIKTVFGGHQNEHSPNYQTRNDTNKLLNCLKTLRLVLEAPPAILCVCTHGPDCLELQKSLHRAQKRCDGLCLNSIEKTAPTLRGAPEVIIEAPENCRVPWDPLGDP